MSLSKELCLRSDSRNSHSFSDCFLNKFQSKEDNYRRDSFDDRFCDDLSEVILQYLSLEDKLRFECVSKQFQRTVFQKIYELDLDDSDFWATQRLDTLAKKFHNVNNFSIFFSEPDLRLLLHKMKAFPALKTLKLWTDFTCFLFTFSFEAFKGLSNITHLTLDFYLTEYSETLDEKMLKHIDINLPNLHYLEINDIFHTTTEGVIQMAGILSRLSRLQTLKLKFKFHLKLFLTALKAFPALKRLDLWSEWCDLTLSFEAFEGLSNITHLTLHLNLGKYSYERVNEEILKQININLPNLQYLEIKNAFDTTPEGVTEIADILSRLSRLETLKLKFKSGVDFKPIEEQITEKCRKIKEIEIVSELAPDFDDYSYYESDDEYLI